MVLNGRLAGPTICVTAAVHGDEINGVEAIRRLLMELRPAEIRGTVIAVPVVNELGFMAGERYLPDGMKDVQWYRPTDRGMEAKIAEKLNWLREQDRKAKGD